MNEAIIASWNSLVGANDEVWVLGDLAMGKIDESLALLARLAGRIVLVPGNHDRCSPLRGSGSASWSERYRRAGIARIEPGPVRMEVAGRAVLADHFPYRFQDEDVADPNARPERYPEAHPVDNGQWLLHGHVHERWRQRGRMVNVGVDAWGGRPVSADELAAIMDRGARRLGCLEWKVSELAS
jgi:calcineurin-like phosphoesterase family protein